MAKLFAYNQSVGGGVTFIQTDDATVDGQWGAVNSTGKLENGTAVAQAWRYADATLNGSSNGVASYTGLVETYINPNVPQSGNAGVQMIGGALTFTAGTAEFSSPTGAGAVATTNTIATRMVMSRPWTISQLYAKINAAAGSGKHVVVTVMKNGTDSALTTDITGTTATTGNDLTHSVSGNAGDDLCVDVTSTSGGSAVIAAWGFTINYN